MAGRAPSEASERKPAARKMQAIGELLAARGYLDEWMSCKRCGCGALAHGFDEPSQRCICGKCSGYRCRL